ncbi:hypothetical protein SK128_009965 [Halocaridina rubra]|uniref:MYND-type domain-containing protein n=1 Tax=Halocaridina rubra TaxID=373956 RepID=A0AAN8WLM6_HALRR
MDAARDPDACMEDKSKKTGSGDEQDINDNHTKVSDEGDKENGASGDPENEDLLANGEIQTKENENNGEKEGENGIEGEGDSNTKEEAIKDNDSETVGEIGELSVAEEEPHVVVEGSEEEGSEDDEDKLVISEGNERGTEDSADENSKGEPPIILPKRRSRSPTPKAAEKRPAEDEACREAPSKRQRQLDEHVPINSLNSISQVETSIGHIRKDLEAIEFLIKQKEEEWNHLISLQKRKEEMYVRLLRKRTVLHLKSAPVEVDGKADEEPQEENPGNILYMPQTGNYSLGNPQLPLMMMSQLLASSVSPHTMPPMPHVTTKPEHNRGSGIGNGNPNISIIDIHTQNNKPGEVPRVSMSSEAHSKLSKQLTSGLASMKPILPKPPTTSSSLSGLPPSISFTATGHGPQGPTVNVQQLIAAHRKENPNTPPIRRATRGAWRHRYDGDKRSSREHDRPPSVSSSSSDADTRTTPTSKNLLAMSDPSVSYKDVLMRFAELTQIEKQPGSPQISIFPVGNVDSVPKRSESSRESTPATRDHTPPLPPTVPPPPTSKSSLEAPSALAKLLLESRNNSSGGSSNKSPIDTVANSQYLTLSALLSGGSTTTIKEKTASHSQAESRSKKSSHQEEGSGNPKCQGCHKQRAQFVCAGCGNQWYCSRECQVAAWEEHSEHCNT